MNIIYQEARNWKMRRAVILRSGNLGIRHGFHGKDGFHGIYFNKSLKRPRSSGFIRLIRVLNLSPLMLVLRRHPEEDQKLEREQQKDDARANPEIRNRAAQQIKDGLRFVIGELVYDLRIPTVNLPELVSRQNQRRQTDR